MVALDRLYRDLALHASTDIIFIGALLLGETILGCLIIRFVSYTEIDWEAYMQEVEMWMIDGEYDYRKIRGGTGPLVYPAGFLYLFRLLRYFTREGKDLRTAQFIFLAMYISTQTVVLAIYQQVTKWVRGNKSLRTVQEKANLIWSWRIAMIVICLSKRVHSIFMLRLFNDGPTMLLLYAAILLFTRHYWDLGCVVFSLAVSIKMNVLLFAPGLLLLLLQVGPDLKTVIRRLGFCCALPQLILGAPFLMRYPVSYLRKAFELDRVFFYKWTVNWKFLSEEMFVSKPLSMILLFCHVAGLVIAAMKWLHATKRATGNQIFLRQGDYLSPHYVTYTLLVSNFIGIAFARTLHYQFYSWYFHALPYLLWSNNVETTSPSPFLKDIMLRLGVMGLIEYAFLTFPATAQSSAALQLAHWIILIQIRPPLEILSEKDDDKKQKKI